MTPRRALSRLLLPALLIAGSVSNCARNPVTGKNELSLVSESQEIEMGKQASQEVAQTIGIYQNPQLEAYVSGIGKRIAAASERPNLPWEFHVVNDASVNAFALPGGFIYVTRGLLGYVTNEAELATVVGHEIGHVTNRHSVQQISKAQVAQLGLGLGSILSPQVAQLAGVASQGLQLLFLKYSRDYENQADLAGFRYALNQGYDVRQMSNMFETLDRVGQASGGGKLPQWLETHPDPENRIKATEQRLDTLHKDLSKAIVGRDQYLQHVQNLTFGEDPRQGYFVGNRFYHPDLRFQLTFPEGWQTQNGASAVVAQSPAQDAMFQLGLAGKASPREAAQQFLSQQGIQAGQSSTASINGLPAATSYFQAQDQQGGTIQGVVSFVSYNGTTYGLMGYTAGGKLGTYDQAFRQSIGSFSQLSDPAALNVKPAKVELVKLPRQMTLEQFNAQYPSTIPIEQLAIINEIAEPASSIPAGTTVKRVVGGMGPKGENQAVGQ
ncbi:MAG TPA: M48 family metalloprotease [Gemmatimonadales bacterium]|jgi:predicted Zn-dependent protease|nr:M48 family metalloprotease [Gemmatimonadales bacterium]